jgi:hypothetical protein
MPARTLVLGIALALLLAQPGLAAADPVEAVTFSTATPYVTTGPFSAGFVFSVTVPIQVTDLGAFDLDGDGLLNTHEVGIYDNNTTDLLASVTVTSADPLIDGFRYAPITPMTLDPSSTYIVAAGDYDGMNEDSAVLVLPADLTVAPGILYYQGAVSQVNAGLHYPTLGFQPDLAAFGGSFRYTVAPEPTELELAGTSLLGLLALAWCGRSRTRAPSD